MKLTDIGEVIAERDLSIQGDLVAKVVVRMGKPQPFPDGTGAYFCPYQITAFGNQRIMYAGGVDAFQAIELCFHMIGIELAALSRDRGRQFRWDADEQGGWGFPFPDAFKN
jgi:hypothetical protein